jgi:hypothetical protein
MIVLLFIGLIACMALGLILLARRESRAVDQRWRSFAASVGGSYTPRHGAGTTPTIELTRHGLPIRIFVHVGHGVVNGVARSYNSLRTTATPPNGTGREFHFAYLPDAQRAPILMGDDSAPVSEWLAGVDASVKRHPGISISSDGAQLCIDLPRKRDSIQEFESLLTIVTQLLGSLDTVRATPGLANSGSPMAPSIQTA